MQTKIENHISLSLNHGFKTMDDCDSRILFFLSFVYQTLTSDSVSFCVSVSLILIFPKANE